MQCLRKSGAYLHEARVFLHQLFGEGHFCKETGSLANPEYQVQNGLVLIDDEVKKFVPKFCVKNMCYFFPYSNKEIIPYIGFFFF